MPKVTIESASEGATTENVGGGPQRSEMADALSGSRHATAAKDVCLWFLAKNKRADAKRGLRDRLKLENQLALAA